MMRRSTDQGRKLIGYQLTVREVSECALIDLQSLAKSMQYVSF
jgi:hypothetical protein